VRVTFRSLCVSANGASAGKSAPSPRGLKRGKGFRRKRRPLGSELGGAIEQMLVTSKHVEAFESIINKFSRQGGTPFSQGHREGAPPAGKIPGYENMSFEQKRAAQMRMNPPAQRTTRDIR
jgi:hypothetical protein